MNVEWGMKCNAGVERENKLKMIESIKQFEPQLRRGIRLRIPHSPFPPPHFRRAISLLEVLVSMFILTVGLLSIASLLPLGSYQAQKALTEDAKASIGHNAYREFRTRAMAQPTAWWHYLEATQATDLPKLVIDNTGYSQKIRTNDNRNQGVNYLPLSVAIDPLALARPASSSTDVGGFKSKFFPRLPDGQTDNNGNPRMVRVTLANIPDPDIAREIAALVFQVRDDTVWDKSTNPDGPAISRWETDNPNSPGVWFRREFAGNYSWLATLTPTYVNSTGAQTQWNLSIVIFHRRSLATRQTEDGQEVERQVTVKGDSWQDYIGFGLGGGELTIQGSNPNNPELGARETAVRPGQWVMVCGRYYSPNLSANTHNRPVFHWFRVVTAGDFANNERQVTLAGPDWNWHWDRNDTQNSAKWCRPTHVAIFNDCVGVFEKTIHLEGPSMYAP
jgi:type II secretory pathway pseudopilin PulG